MAVGRRAALEWSCRNRARAPLLLDLIGDAARYSPATGLRHPIVFYEGHLPAFSFNTLVKKALGGPGIDARLEALFARGIDPHEAGPKGSAGAQKNSPPRAAGRPVLFVSAAGAPGGGADAG